MRTQMLLKYGLKLLMLATLASSEAKSASTGCEVFAYSNTTIWIDGEYYALPSSPDGLVTLRLRYRDLKPTSSEGDTYDPRELNDPGWNIGRSNKVALLQIHRQPLRWPESVPDLDLRYPNGRTVTSDWPGWLKYERCSTTCSTDIYLSDQWRTQGVAFVDCPKINNRNLMLQNCIAHARVQGLFVEFSFPALRKLNFSDFQTAIQEFMRTTVRKGTEKCHAQ